MKAKQQRAFTLRDLIALMVIISLLFGVSFVWYELHGKYQMRISKCKSNLRQLGIGMIQYIDQYGKGRYYSWPGPQEASFSGSQWIASLYWTSLYNQPDLFICPGSADGNQAGANLGRRFTRLGAGDVSYAGRNGMMGTILDKMPSNTVMMSDDSEGPNHHPRDGLNILYFDAHTEWSEEVEPKDVGRTRPLDMLRN